MKTTVVYIDGSNLYYGQLRGSVNKWLDPEKFSKKLPDSFETNDGRTIHCPAAWMPCGPVGS